MRVHPRSQGFHLGGQLGDGCGVAFGQLFDAPGQGLADAVQFALDAGGECGEPFVVDDQRLDVGHAELAVVGGYFDL